jgi:hypothetical protein
MKYLLILLMICGVAYAQEPPYTPMKGNYKFKGIKVDSLFLIPSFADTTAANSTFLDSVAGAMIRTGNDFWMRNAELTSWLQNINIGPGSNPTTQLTLQNVLDNNHDLVNGNNFQGTNAGVGNSGSGNILFGDGTGYNSNGSYNIYMGPYAGEQTVGDNNIAMGSAALADATYYVGNSIFLGPNAGRLGAASLASSEIVALGNQAAMDFEWGYNVNAIGVDAFHSGYGEQINAIGNRAAYDNQGNNVNAIGYSSAETNQGSEVNGIGTNAAGSNRGNNINALGNSTALLNWGDDVNAMGYHAADSNIKSNINALGYTAGFHNSGEDVNFFGRRAGYYNTFNAVNLFGNQAQATADKQLVFSDGTYNTRINFGVEDSSREYTIPPKADGTFALTGYYEADLTVSGYDAITPGVYLLNNGYAEFFNFPNPNNMKGQLITVINLSGSTVTYGANSPIRDVGLSIQSTIPNSTTHICAAINGYWYLIGTR